MQFSKYTHTHTIHTHMRARAVEGGGGGMTTPLLQYVAQFNGVDEILGPGWRGYEDLGLDGYFPNVTVLTLRDY